MTGKTARRLLTWVLLFLLFLSADPVRAAESWNNAASFYREYGNDAVFHPIGDSDGEICYGTCARSSSAGVKYRTIGWKMTLYDSENRMLQTLYYKLGGEDMALADLVREEDCIYRLYKLKLSTLRKELTETTLEQIRSGDCRLQLDAIMVVAVNGTPLGGMEEDGSFRGSVYTTYEGISRAAFWTSSAKESQKSYFGKAVKGFFIEVLATDHPPVLSAGDLYVSREAVQAGKVTEAWICSKFSAEDPEDGFIAGSKLVGITEKELLLAAQKEEEVSCVKGRIQVTDSGGNMTEKEVAIFMISTELKQGTELTGRIRFISRDYFEDAKGKPIPKERGGLMENSVWSSLAEYKRLLKSVLD